MKPTPQSRGEQSPRRTAHTYMLVGSAVYLVLGLACLGDFHTATLMGGGYLMLSASYLRAYRQEHHSD